MSLASHAEVLKLARLLGRDAEALDYLVKVPAEDLSRLREQVTDVLYDGDRQALGRIADAARILPAGFMATVGEKVFGPTLCARLSGLLAPDRALEVAVLMSPSFLAAIGAETDPRRSVSVITRIPAELIERAAAVMAAGGETVAMGRFVGFLEDETLRRCIAVVPDAQLLRIAFVLEGKDRLDRLIALLPDERIPAVLAAAEREELWKETLDLFAHLGDEQLDRIARLAGDGPLPKGLTGAAAEHGALDVLERIGAYGFRAA